MKYQGFDGFGCEVYEKDGTTWLSTRVSNSLSKVLEYAEFHRAKNRVCKLMTVNEWGTKIDYID